MRASSFDFMSNLDTILAVVFGALLATVGALIAEIIQDRLGRKRRERDAARFFGEIISSVWQILDLAFQSQKIGDPWGRYSVRLLEVAAREATVYERNRERLFEVLDMDLRFRVNGHLLRTSVPIEDIVSYCHELKRLERAAEIGSSLSTQEVEKRTDDIISAREGSLNQLKTQQEDGQVVLRELEKLANASFGARYGSVRAQTASSE